MKKIVAFLIASLALGAIPTQANADQRLVFQSFRNLVVMGSFSNLSLTSQHIASTAADWMTLKYEVLVPDDLAVSSSYRAVQSSQIPCGGVLTGSGNSSICEGYLVRGRNVVNAGISQSSTTYNLAGGVSLRGHSSSEFEVVSTAWLDLNGDGKISSYEPKTAPAIITFITANSLAASINFEVDPPRVHDGGITGWLSSFSGREGWGQGLASILDLTNFKVFVERCYAKESSCALTSYSPTFVAHPQLQAHSFNMSHEWAGYSKTTIKLAYFETPQDFYVLAERVFNYEGDRPSSAETKVNAKSVTTQPKPSWPVWPHERVTYVPDNVSEFNYSARFLRSNRTPMAGETVDLKFDMTEFADSENIMIDGRPLSSFAGETRDVIWLKRTTDANGEVSVAVSTKLPSIRQSLSIEAQIRGHEAHRGLMGGYSERVMWLPSLRTFKLEAQANGTKELLISAQLIGPVTYGTNFPVVQFISSENVVLSSSVASLNGNPSPSPLSVASVQTSAKVRLNAISQGRETIRARVNLAGVWYEAQLSVVYNGSTGELAQEKAQSNSTVSAVGVSVSSGNSGWRVLVTNAAGKTIAIKAGSRWFKATAATNSQIFSNRSRVGSTIRVTVYVDGQLQLSQNVTIKR